jgi:hypothetical protein
MKDRTSSMQETEKSRLTKFKRFILLILVPLLGAFGAYLASGIELSISISVIIFVLCLLASRWPKQVGTLVLTASGAIFGYQAGGLVLSVSLAIICFLTFHFKICRNLVAEILAALT